MIEALPDREQFTAGAPTVEAAQPVNKGDKFAGDLPYQEAHHFRITLAAGESMIFRLTTRIPGDEMYPTTRMQVLDATGAARMEWRSSLWKSSSTFTPDAAGDYVLRIENAQFPDYPWTIHYTVSFE